MKILRISYVLMIYLLSCPVLTAQETTQETTGESFTESTEFIGNIYSHFRADLNKSARSFDVNRAYLGFISNIAPGYEFILKLDIGSPEDLLEESLIKRYAYFKNAGLIYTKNKLKLSFGIIDMYQFKVAEKFWDHRYLYKSLMDEHRFGTSADIGGRIEYRAASWLSGDFTVSNGEGYSKLQLDNSFKLGFGATIDPSKTLRLRAYYDVTNKDSIYQSTVSFFTGFTYKRFKIGGDIDLVTNASNENGEHKWGYSVYSMFRPAERWEIFARYDLLTSTKLSTEDYGWNIENDGSAIIAGIQFRPISKVNIALNYQAWFPDSQGLRDEPYIYVNFEFKL